MRKWTKAEEEKLKKLYSEQGIRIHEIAKILGRSYNSVKTKVTRLGLKRPNGFKIVKWTKDMDDILRREYPITSARDIAKKLEVSLQSVYARAQLLGLKKQVIRKSTIGEWFTPEIDKVKSDEMAYIAGFMDGEGSFLIEKRVSKRDGTPLYVPVIQVVNTNRNVIDFINKKLGGGKYRYTEDDRGWKTCYLMKIRQTKKVMAICRMLIPYLIVKKEQAKLLYEFCKAKLQGNINKQEEIYNKLRVMIHGKIT